MPADLKDDIVEFGEGQVKSCITKIFFSSGSEEKKTAGVGRGLTVSTGITITADGSGNLVISATGGGAATTAASLGAGTSLIGNGAGPNLTFKSLVAGTNIGLVADANTISISSLLVRGERKRRPTISA